MTFEVGFYILHGKFPVRVSLSKWSSWSVSAECRVAETSVMNDEGEIWVSTVFLGIDTSYLTGDHDPVVFETMIFGGAHDSRMNRYVTWDEALLGHKKLTRLARMSVLWEKKKKENEKVQATN